MYKNMFAACHLMTAASRYLLQQCYNVVISIITIIIIIRHTHIVSFVKVFRNVCIIV